MTKLLAAALILTAPALIFAGPAHYFDEPDTAYATNVVIDIIEHAGGIWFATGEGVNFSFDNGETWLLYDSSNGLPSSDISAIFSSGPRLWVASNHVGLVDGAEEIFSDGLSYTDDNGQNWVTIDFGPSGENVPFVTGPFRTIYDITGVNNYLGGHDWLFAAAFAGGFIASSDGGDSWKRIFPVRTDSINFAQAYSNPAQAALSLRNRYFSCAVDTSHTDSLFVWAGTAGGVLQYIFVLPEDRFSTYGITDVAFCRSCSEDSMFVFVGGKAGVTRGNVTGDRFITRSVEHGLPGPMVTGLFEFNGIVFAGTADSTSGASTGLAYSTDYGESFDVLVAEGAVLGMNRQIRDFAATSEHVFFAGQEAGLWGPSWSVIDSFPGPPWQQFVIDSSNMTPANGWNVVWAVEAVGDTLFVGTDSGLAVLFIGSDGLIDSTRLESIPNDANSSSRVISVEAQLFDPDSLTGIADSFHIWTVNRPLTTGTPAVGRSRDRGETWSFYHTGVYSKDLAILGDTVYVVDTSSVQLADLGLDTVVFSKAGIHVGADTIANANTVTTFGDLVAVGANRTLALSLTYGKTFRFYQPNTEVLRPNIVGLYTDTTTQNLDSNNIRQPGLLGNFIPAVAVRDLAGESAQVLASCRPTNQGTFGISLGTQVPVTVVTVDTTDAGDTVNVITDTVGYAYRWDPIYDETFAWNFDVDGDSLVYAATEAGLLIGREVGTDEQTLDTLDFRSANGQDLVFPGTPVYAVRRSNEYLWVGTDDGTVRVDVDDLNQTLFITTDPSEDIYAFPVPFSPNQGERARFHFTVPADGNISLEIFDFAMNLVATPIDNQFFRAGVYPPGPEGDARPYWDGYNDKGDMVAVGMYYIRFTDGNGEVKWGKMAVVP